MANVYAKSNANVSSSPFLQAVRQVPWPRLNYRKAVIDIRGLSDHLKRDLGILDGNDPRGRRK